MRTMIDCLHHIAREKYDYDDWEKMCKYLLIDGYPDEIEKRFKEALDIYRSQFTTQLSIIASL